MFSNYEDAIRMYLIHALIMWPQKTNDNETLSKLYTTLFSKLAKIQLKLSKALPTTQYVFPVIENIIHHSVALPSHIDHIASTLHLCKQENIVREAEDTIDAVWKITFDLFHLVYQYYSPRRYNLGKVKDWRELFVLLKQHPDLMDSMNIIYDGLLFKKPAKKE
jgi:hypothetical protein